MGNILITGASRGIGRATAHLAAEVRWSVAVNWRADEAAALATAAEVEGCNCRALPARGDVSASPYTTGAILDVAGGR